MSTPSRTSRRRNVPPKTEDAYSDYLKWGLAAGAVAVVGLIGYTVLSELTKPTKKKKKVKSPTKGLPSPKLPAGIVKSSLAPRPPGVYYDKTFPKIDGCGMQLVLGDSGRGAWVAAGTANTSNGLKTGSCVFEIGAVRVTPDASYETILRQINKSPLPVKITFREDSTVGKNWEEAEKFKTQANDSYSKGDIVGAKDLYKKAIDLHPTNKTYYSNRVLALMKSGTDEDLKVALSHCLKLRELDVFHTYKKGHHLRGLVLSKIGNYKHAVQAFSSVLSIDPDNKMAKDRMEECRKKMKEQEKESANDKMMASAVIVSPGSPAAEVSKKKDGDVDENSEEMRAAKEAVATETATKPVDSPAQAASLKA